MINECSFENTMFMETTGTGKINAEPNVFTYNEELCSRCFATNVILG